MRLGIGYDIHPLKAGRKLILGGVDIPFSKGLLGHSDGDVLLHAIMDAVLGAAGAGDIGDFFPDSDSRYKNADSLLFAGRIRALLKKKGLKVKHVDSTLLAEAPKLSDYKKKMRENIAKAFELPPARVGVKAKTNEGFGAVGKGKAIACFAVVSLG